MTQEQAAVEYWEKKFKQQADRIAELEKDLHIIERHYDQLGKDVSSKPVAWSNKKELSKITTKYDPLFAWKKKYFDNDIPLYTHPVKQFNEKEFNAIAYSYRSWPSHDPKGVSERYQELLNYIKEITE